jgi:hypothetical protein
MDEKGFVCFVLDLENDPIDDLEESLGNVFLNAFTAASDSI